jgi:DNA-directed RNA polymerase specialized sigma24 family protein
MTVIEKLQRYKVLKAEIKNIELDIEELHESENIGPGAISYEEKSGPTHKFSSQTENEAVNLADKTIRLEGLKRAKEREIERIDNALSILDDKQREVIELKHVRGCRWDTVTYKLDRSYSYCKQLENEALLKIEPFL